MDSFVLCVRNVDSNGQFGNDVGTPTYLRVPESDTMPKPAHAISTAAQWMNAIATAADPPGNKDGEELDVVFFVHGYNTNPDEALLRQRLVEDELAKRGYACVVIGFDWPTAGNAAAYAFDRFKAQDAAAALVKGGIVPFTNFTLPTCTVNIHVMAHSMGAFVVREAFRSVDKGRDANLSNDWRIGQLVLFAADLSSECFALGDPQMQPVFDHCGRLTNYFSGYDEALAVSNAKNLDIGERVGRVGMPEETEAPTHRKALDVDCGPRYAAVPNRKFKVIHGMTSHSWYLEDSVWYDDLAAALAGAIDRNLFPTRTKIGDDDFVLNKK